MPVALLPPLTSSGPSSRRPGVMPLAECERYARTKAMSRFHRVRSGVVTAEGVRTLYLWCGSFVFEGNGGVLLADTAGDDSVCAVCEGKALGAGQDELPAGMPRLRYDPRWLTPPALCPGSGDSGLWVEVPNSRNIVRCLACGDLVSGRASGGPYNPRWGAVKHSPGVSLVEPCAFHAWNHLVRDGERVLCECGWQP